ncbi:hypothetical protein [Halovenus sp. HT40]|uniref:hypothetical protein n=1 Tax=Halovenus sp. HT40 TaxID=3126691 RepID=UPI00300EE29A
MTGNGLSFTNNGIPEPDAQQLTPPVTDTAITFNTTNINTLEDSAVSPESAEADVHLTLSGENTITEVWNELCSHPAIVEAYGRAIRTIAQNRTVTEFYSDLNELGITPSFGHGNPASLCVSVARGQQPALYRFVDAVSTLGQARGTSTSDIDTAATLLRFAVLNPADHDTESHAASTGTETPDTQYTVDPAQKLYIEATITSKFTSQKRHQRVDLCHLLDTLAATHDVTIKCSPVTEAVLRTNHTDDLQIDPPGVAGSDGTPRSEQAVTTAVADLDPDTVAADVLRTLTNTATGTRLFSELFAATEAANSTVRNALSTLESSGLIEKTGPQRQRQATILPTGERVIEILDAEYGRQTSLDNAFRAATESRTTTATDSQASTAEASVYTPELSTNNNRETSARDAKAPTEHPTQPVTAGTDSLSNGEEGELTDSHPDEYAPAFVSSEPARDSTEEDAYRVLRMRPAHRDALHGVVSEGKGRGPNVVCIESALPTGDSETVKVVDVDDDRNVVAVSVAGNSAYQVVTSTSLALCSPRVLELLSEERLSAAIDEYVEEELPNAREQLLAERVRESESVDDRSDVDLAEADVRARSRERVMQTMLSERCLGWIGSAVVTDPGSVADRLREVADGIRDAIAEASAESDAETRREKRSDIMQSAHGLAGVVADLLELIGVDVCREIRVSEHFSTDRFGEIAETIVHNVSVSSRYGDAVAYRQLFEHRDEKRSSTPDVDVSAVDPFGDAIGMWVIRSEAASRYHEAVTEEVEAWHDRVQEDAPEFAVPVTVQSGAGRQAFAVAAAQTLQRKELVLSRPAVSVLSTVCRAPFAATAALERIVRAADAGKRRVSSVELKRVLATLSSESVFPQYTDSVSEILSAVLAVPIGEKVRRSELMERTGLSVKPFKSHRDAIASCGFVDVDRAANGEPVYAPVLGCESAGVEISAVGERHRSYRSRGGDAPDDESRRGGRDDDKQVLCDGGVMAVFDEYAGPPPAGTARGQPETTVGPDVAGSSRSSSRRGGGVRANPPSSWPSVLGSEDSAGVTIEAEWVTGGWPSQISEEADTLLDWYRDRVSHDADGYTGSRTVSAEELDPTELTLLSLCGVGTTGIHPTVERRSTVLLGPSVTVQEQIGETANSGVCGDGETGTSRRSGDGGVSLGSVVPQRLYTDIRSNETGAGGDPQAATRVPAQRGTGVADESLAGRTRQGSTESKTGDEVVVADGLEAIRNKADSIRGFTGSEHDRGSGNAE